MGQAIADVARRLDRLQAAQKPSRKAQRDKLGTSDPTVTTYEGLTVFSAEPSGSGADLIQDNFKTLADGHQTLSNQLGSLTTSSVAEGTNLYFTTSRASAAAPVQSVAGRTGAVTLSYTDIGGLGSAATANSSDFDAASSAAAVQSNVTSLTTTVNGKLTASNNLSDLTNSATARTNLGLGNIKNVDTTNASNISSGTIGSAYLPNLSNTYLSTSGGTVGSVVVNGTINATGNIETTANYITCGVGGLEYGSGAYLSLIANSGLNLVASSGPVTIQPSGTYGVTVQGGTNSSGYNAFSITPTYTQSGTATATDLYINRTETSVGSGNQYLINAAVGGTSKFSVNHLGYITTPAITSTIQVITPTVGANGNNTTLNLTGAAWSTAGTGISMSNNFSQATSGQYNAVAIKTRVPADKRDRQQY